MLPTSHLKRHHAMLFWKKRLESFKHALAQDVVDNFFLGHPLEYKFVTRAELMKLRRTTTTFNDRTSPPASVLNFVVSMLRQPCATNKCWRSSALNLVPLSFPLLRMHSPTGTQSPKNRAISHGDCTKLVSSAFVHLCQRLVLGSKPRT